MSFEDYRCGCFYCAAWPEDPCENLRKIKESRATENFLYAENMRLQKENADLKEDNTFLREMAAEMAGEVH